MKFSDSNFSVFLYSPNKYNQTNSSPHHFSICIHANQVRVCVCVREREREITFGTGWDGESHDLLVVNESPPLQTGIYCALGRLYRWAKTLQTSSIPDMSASNAFHHGGFSGRGTWNLRAAAYTTPQATTSLLNRTHKVVRKLLKKRIVNEAAP